MLGVRTVGVSDTLIRLETLINGGVQNIMTGCLFGILIDRVGVPEKYQAAIQVCAPSVLGKI